MKLLQIVPSLPPTISGVGDYALLLARELATDHGVQSHFLSGDPGWRGHEEGVAPFTGESLETRSVAALLEALQNALSCEAVLLHYVGHGYEPRGCPFWLVRALERWRSQCSIPLIVLFHEVSGNGPVWTSGFWTSGLQALLAKRLVRLVDSLHITTEVAAKRVRAMLPMGSSTPLKVLPVFSNLGEPSVLLPYGKRAREMIVFGGAGWRRRAYTRHVATLEAVCRRMRLNRVIGIGPPTGLKPKLTVPFEEAGVLPAWTASELMSKAVAGFFTYPVLHSGKSGIFAAYCAHGLVPVTFAENAFPGDQGLLPENHFITGASDVLTDDTALSKVAASAHLWYRQHRLAVHACELHESLLKLARSAT